MIFLVARPVDRDAPVLWADVGRISASLAVGRHEADRQEHVMQEFVSRYRMRRGRAWHTFIKLHAPRIDRPEYR